MNKCKMSKEQWAKQKEQVVRPLEWAVIPEHRVGRKMRRAFARQQAKQLRMEAKKRVAEV